MLREWLPLTSSGYPSTQTGPAPLTPYLKYSVSASLISLPLSSDFLLSYLLFLFTLFHPSHFSPSISLVHPSFHFPSAIHHSLVLFFPFPLSLFPSSPPVLPLPPPFLAACFAWSFHLVVAYCWLHICCGVNFTSVSGWQERLITPRSPSPWLWAYLMNKYINK